MFLQPMPTMADRISTLPDSILCHILSYLPTKLAVATSILSKRWRPLWLSVPTLDFDDRGYTENGMIYSRFIHLVYRTMLLRDGGQPIKVFNLKCTSFFFCDPSIVDTWVTAATKRKVEHLSLLLASTISLPSSVLTSRTLVVLKLKGLIVDITPPSVDLPSLKTLHLREVQFLERRYVVEFLSACPVLEDLLMKFLKVPNSFMEIMNVGMLKPLPKLVRADISKSNIDLPFKALCNAEFLRADVGFFFKPYSFLNMTYMELIFQPHYWVVLIDLLRSCPSLQNLVIDKIEENIPYMRGGSFIDSLLDLEPQFVPCCLKAQLKKFCFRKYGGEEHELQFTSYVMQNARILRCVTICSTGSSNFQKKLEMLKKLSVCPRNSTTCQLYFE